MHQEARELDCCSALEAAAKTLEADGRELETLKAENKTLEEAAQVKDIELQTLKGEIQRLKAAIEAKDRQLYGREVVDVETGEAEVIVRREDPPIAHREKRAREVVFEAAQQTQAQLKKVKIEAQDHAQKLEGQVHDITPVTGPGRWVLSSGGSPVGARQVGQVRWSCTHLQQKVTN